MSESATRPLPASETGEQRHRIERVRQETRRRALTVASVERLTPCMRRIHFLSADLGDFASPSPDDHIKLFLPQPDGETIKRDYTPRRFDSAAGTFTIDFAVHEAGPATAWALNAQPGEALEIGGPRGSVIVPHTFDWYLLVGDETALPAIGRWVEALPAGASVTTVAVVDDARERQSFETAANWSGEWIFRDREGQDDAEAAARAIDRLYPGRGDGFVWIAGEAQFAKALRAHLAERHGHPLPWMRASGYWLRGQSGAHSAL